MPIVTIKEPQTSEMVALLSAAPGPVPVAFRCHFLSVTAADLLEAPRPQASGGTLVVSHILCDHLSLCLWSADTEAYSEGASQLQEKMLFPFSARFTHLLSCFYVNLMTLLLKGHLDMICGPLGSLFYKIHTHQFLLRNKGSLDWRAEEG